MILIPAITIILLFLNFFCKSGDLPRSLANVWITLTLFIWTVTEGLSAFKVWTKTGVFLSWIFLLIFLLWVSWRFKLYYGLNRILKAAGKWKKELKKYRFFVIIALLFLLLVLGTTILRGQTNVDSLIYHLPRIKHWIQNQSVGHYATHTDLQVRYPALAEYFVSQIYLFGCSDRVANIIQTIAYLCSGVMIWGIAIRLGARYMCSFMAACIYWLMPMAIGQAYTTQTDNIAGMFLLVYIYFLLDFIEMEKLQFDYQGCLHGIRLGMTIMFGYLCKPTICFDMVVFFIWMCIIRICRRDSLSVLAKYAFVGGSVLLLLYMPTFMRSYATYNRHVQEEQEDKAIEMVAAEKEQNFLKDARNMLAPDSNVVTDAFKDRAAFIMTGLQNLARNSFSSCFPEWNVFVSKVVGKMGAILHYDIVASGFEVQKNDGVQFYQSDTASNPAIMLFMWGMVCCIIMRLSKTNKMQTAFACCSVLGFLVQCGLMGFTIYRSRYLVGAMAVLCPAIAVTLQTCKVSSGSREKIAIILLTVAAFGGINTFTYQIKATKESLTGESYHQYFEFDTLEEYYAQMVQFVEAHGYVTVGMEGKIYREYVLWQEIDNLERMESVNVKGVLAKYEDKNFIPECIVREATKPTEIGDILNCHGVKYQCGWVKQRNATFFSVYIPI